jgi:hypothetical protein
LGGMAAKIGWQNNAFAVGLQCLPARCPNDTTDQCV